MVVCCEFDSTLFVVRRYRQDLLNGVPGGELRAAVHELPGDCLDAQAEVVINPQLNVVLDTEAETKYMPQSVVSMMTETVFSKQIHDRDSDPGCVIDTTGKIIFRIQE